MKNKIVLFIFEGISDKLALSAALENSIKIPGRTIDFFEVNGDVLTEYKDPEIDIIPKIRNLFAKYIKERNGLKASDIEMIVQIVDTDGAFIADDFINFESVSQIEYREMGIYCQNIDELRRRNRIKSYGLQRLSKCKSIIYCKQRILYRICYMSCNLEHVLHNIISVEKNEKIQYAKNFAMKHAKNIKDFSALLNNEDIKLGNSFDESWNYIQNGLESLHRHSNLCFILDELGNSEYKSHL